MYNSKTNFKVKYQQELSKKVEVKSDLLQGVALSLTLFNIALECVVRTAIKTWKMEEGEIKIILAYADDVVILRNSRNEVEQSTKKLLEQARSWA